MSGLLPLALGSLVGLVLALTGAGGAILAVPLLIFVAHLDMNQAAPVALLAVAISAGFGALLAFKAGTLRYRAAAWMAATGWAASFAGMGLAHQLPDKPLLIVFAITLAGVSWRMHSTASRELLGELLARPAAPPCMLDAALGRLQWNTRCTLSLGLAGAAAGFLSGLLGVGGGFVVVPVLLSITNLPMRAVIATSMGVLALVALAGVLNASAAGVMPWLVAWPFAGGAIAGMLAGRVFAGRIAGPRLQQGFAIVSAGAALGLIARAMA